MSQAIILLQMAIALLSMAQSIPNLPPAIMKQVVELSNTAVQVANQELSKPKVYIPKAVWEYSITADEFIKNTRVISTSTTQIFFVTDLNGGKSVGWNNKQKEIDLNDYIKGYKAPKVNIDWVCSEPPVAPTYDFFHPVVSDPFYTCVVWIGIGNERSKLDTVFQMQTN